ncbi:DUF3223 domain-containing protein [Mesorhizobium sp.]|uniref:DUF3223 domain-containing protein n=1 Tax=Mesorhizobium sp. TaxID=1871066 RepID=UPI000FEA74B6|nr:DUF3223 domain-containing protein [Mesorhizobium sp.]RWE30482.1 MAG: DUF3223 domain-containing protein [Mesorhizobium sp.]
MGIEIVIGDISFPTKEAAIAHCRAILHRSSLDTEITGNDASFVEALLYARPDKVAELAGRKVVRYLRKMHWHNTPCFFAELDDGSLLDISFMKFINAYPQRPGG